jgi:hypothetical protein
MAADSFDKRDYASTPGRIGRSAVSIRLGRRRWYADFVATRTRADGIEDLRAKILESVRELVGKDVEVEVGWLNESSDDEEILVQVSLADPGSDKTWDQDLTNKIRSAVRLATAEVVPSAVATTRLVSSGDDG